MTQETRKNQNVRIISSGNSYSLVPSFYIKIPKGFNIIETHFNSRFRV